MKFRHQPSNTPNALPITQLPTGFAALDGWRGGGCVVGVAPWLLKYIIYRIFHHKERKGRKVKVTMSLRTLRPLRWTEF